MMEEICEKTVICHCRSAETENFRHRRSNLHREPINTSVQFLYFSSKKHNMATPPTLSEHLDEPNHVH